MRVICPICERQTRPVFRKNETDVLDCAQCRHRCAGLDVADDHTSVYYDDDYFTDGADGYSNYLGDGDIVRQRGVWYANLLQRHGVEPGRVLDVGAAAGFFLKGLTDAGWNGIGLEPNTGMANHATHETGVDVRTGTLESLAADEQFDLISIIQVVAHLTDPMQAFNQAATHTKTGGHWIVETWNYRSLVARLMGRSWHEYSPPRTLHWFSPTSIAKMADRCGMELVAKGHPDKSISGEHAKSLLAHTTKNNRLARALFSPARLIPDRMRIPYPADDLNWFLLRKL